LQRIVQPHLLPREDPQKGELIALVDHAIAALMRAILHHADFQTLEAGWRALDFLVRRLETDGELQLWVLDVSKAEMEAAFESAGDFPRSGIYKVIIEETVGTPGGVPWAALVGNYTFDQTPRDVAVLSCLAQVAQAAGAPFLAAASPRILGCASLAETPDPDDWRPAHGQPAELWEALRQLPEAAYLGLAVPCFLLRLPYGKDTDPLEGFAFEEVAADSRHEDYLWGNPAFACACLLGQAFGEHAWDLRPGVVQDIAGLPLHVYKEGGESRAKPCAEALLTLRAAEAILERGLMPLLSMKDRDVVRLGRFQSLRSPLTPLAGRWGG
jgi:type VI secretion system protein ImpC